MERLKLVAEEGFSDPHTDTGGLLIGRSEDLIESGQHVITIENFEDGVSRLHGVVGFARFRRQTALHLSEADFLALRAGLGLVSLIIRPDGKGGAVGGFFYREGKTVRCPPLRMQFPIEGGASDCRGLECATPEDTDSKTPTTTRRVVYAVVGLALTLSSFTIWLMGR